MAGGAALFLATACGEASAPDKLDSARARWERADYASYSFTAERSCFCTTEGRGPVRVTVQNGAVTSVTMIATGAAVAPEIWFDIDDLFTLIDEQLVQLPSRLETDYDGTLGYPTRIAYGTPENDGGGVIFVRELARN
jgi:hypothetical protein